MRISKQWTHYSLGLLMAGFFFISLSVGCSDSKAQVFPEPSKEKSGGVSENSFPFRVGEKITYSVKKIGVKAGEVTLVYNGPSEINGVQALLITFTAKGVNFYDEEKIYMDPKTLYPMTVIRDLDIWGKKEKITEQYQADKGQVKITKDAKGKKTEQIIEKKDRVDNIYCFIYRSRAYGQFKVGESFEITLPTQDIVIKLEKMAKLKIGGEAYEAYYMKSQPSKYQVWFDSREKKIPLRINGAVGFGDTAMIMIKYEISQ